MASSTFCQCRLLFVALVSLLLLLSASLSDALSKTRKGVTDESILEDSSGTTLIDWIRHSGGQSDVRVGVVDAPVGTEPTSTTTTKKRKRRTKKRDKNTSPGTLRGTLATRDIAAGEMVISIPSNISVPLGGTGVTSPENVVLLFARRASNPSWFEEMKPYWDSLPESVFTKEMYEPEHMALLQDEELVSVGDEERNEETRALFSASLRCCFRVRSERAKSSSEKGFEGRKSVAPFLERERSERTKAREKRESEKLEGER